MSEEKLVGLDIRIEIGRVSDHQDAWDLADRMEQLLNRQEVKDHLIGLVLRETMNLLNSTGVDQCQN